MSPLTGPAGSNPVGTKGCNFLGYMSENQIRISQAAIQAGTGSRVGLLPILSALSRSLRNQIF